MFDPKQALVAVFRYLGQHPEEFLRQLRNGSKLRFGLPLAALQWLAKELENESNGGPRNVEISASPPGLRLKATIEQMGTLVRADCVVVVEQVNLGAKHIRVDLRLRDVVLTLLDDSVQTPLAALIRSGTLDVSRLASLVAYMPSRPAVLVEAVDDRLVLDLMKIPRLEADARLQRWMGRLSSVLAVESISTDAEHLDIAVRLRPSGFSRVLRRNR